MNKSKILASCMLSSSGRSLSGITHLIAQASLHTSALVQGQRSVPNYGWYRQFESGRPDPHQFKKLK